MPKVSIITTTYNRPKELSRAIRSVNEQQYTDWEHIIVHDGPASEATKKVINLYKDERRVFIELPENHGNHTKPKNEGIKASTGEYICYLDDDNEYFPNFVATLVAELEMSDYDVVYGDMRLYNNEIDRGHRGITLDYDAQFLLERSYIDTNEVMYRRGVVYAVGGWDETIPRFADWNLHVRMSKAGFSFRRIPVTLTRYYISKKSSAERFPVKSWTDPHTGLNMFAPTFFVPSTCYIYLPYLGNDIKGETDPRVAIFTITKDRLDYSMAMYKSMITSTHVNFDWFVFDNGSKDGTKEWLEIVKPKFVHEEDENKGLTIGSNACIDEIMRHDYQIIIKVDNDCLFLTKGWLEDFIDLWKRNHKLYLGPYPEGLVDHPGGPMRVMHANIGDEYVEVTMHISGICAFIDARAYRNFRWKDQFLHGEQDVEASNQFINDGYMPSIISKHRIQHMDTTAGQKKKYPEYFEKRKEERATKLQRSYEDVQEQESAFSENTTWGNRVKESVHMFRKYLTGKVLDIGCNDGTAMQEIGGDVRGIDISPIKVRRSRDKGLDATLGYMETLPYGDKEVDSVFCSHTFEHSKDPVSAGKEIMRVASRAVIIVPLEEKTENPAHTTVIDSPEKLKSFFPGAKVIEEKEMERMEKEYAVVLEFV